MFCTVYFENFPASIRSIWLFLPAVQIYMLQILFDQRNYGSLVTMDDIVTKLVTAQVKSLDALVQELQRAVCVRIVMVLLRGVFLSSYHIDG